MRLRLDQIEDRLRRFFEGSSLLLPWGKRQHLLARRMVEAMTSSLREKDGNFSVPGDYTIFLNQENFKTWRSRTDLFDALGQAVQNAAQDAGLVIASAPSIHVEPDASIPDDEFRISAVSEVPVTGQTDIVPVISQNASAEPSDPRPADAFLIIDGSRTLPLRQVVINIGRRQDNHLVVDDPRVSRVHAQLRAVRGRYILFDLNSTGGTYVNGMRITQQQLKPGDVISLAGYAIIYGEDTPPLSGDTDHMGNTRAMDRPPSRSAKPGRAGPDSSSK
jgi:hypothetical protein